MTEYGLQLYSVRDAMETDLDSTVAKVAEMGYRMVEPAGFFGCTAEHWNDLMAQTGLRLNGTHSSWIDLRDRYEETVAFHKAIGNTRYIIPGADLSDAAHITEFCDFVNDVMPRLAADGIELHYHNHSAEFLPNADGQIPHEELQKRTPLFFEIDTYWAYNAGKDPLQIMKELKDRIRVIHVKDGDKKDGLSLGSGTAPVREVVALAKEMGIDMVVESEGLKPDGLSEVRRCIDFLKTLE